MLVYFLYSVHYYVQNTISVSTLCSNSSINSNDDDDNSMLHNTLYCGQAII